MSNAIQPNKNFDNEKQIHIPYSESKPKQPKE